MPCERTVMISIPDTDEKIKKGKNDVGIQKQVTAANRDKILITKFILFPLQCKDNECYQHIIEINLTYL